MEKFNFKNKNEQIEKNLESQRRIFINVKKHVEMFMNIIENQTGMEIKEGYIQYNKPVIYVNFENKTGFYDFIFRNTAERDMFKDIVNINKYIKEV